MAGYSLGVMVSRLSGMCRDIALAYFFGTSQEIALFMVAYRFANLMRRMLAETPLTSSFVPLFEKAKQEGEALAFFRDTFGSLVVLTALITGAIVGGGWGIGSFFSIQGEGMKLAQVMTFSLPAICLYTLCSQLLHCEKKFFLPAAAPVGFNGMWIIGAYWASRFYKMEILAWGVVAAFFVQWLFVMPPLIKRFPELLSFAFLRKIRLFSSTVRSMGKPLVLGALGMGATQINLVLDSLFAKVADPEGPAFLWYAIRLQQVPMALFGVAMTAVLLPAFSRAVKAFDIEQAEWLFSHGIKRSFALMSFSMFGLLALGKLAVMLLFARGSFTEVSLENTWQCLVGYSLGLIPHAAALLLSAYFYAKEDFKTPMKASLYAMGLNAGLNALMVFALGLGALSIALATSLTSLFNALYLFSKMNLITRQVPRVFYLKTLLLGGGCCMVIGGLQKVFFSLYPLQKSSLLGAFVFFLLAAAYCGLYFVLEIKTKSQEVLQCIKEAFKLEKVLKK